MFGYTNITSNATTVVKTGRGHLSKIVVNNPGTTWVLTVYDNTAGSGTKIATIAVTAGQPLHYDLVFDNGLTIVSSGATPGDVTVVAG